MADKSISELVAATAVGSSDLFVLEQTGTAKKLTGQILENWLVSFADGHGGIHDITYTPPVSPSLEGTLTITLADETEYTVTVTDGKGISSITDYWKASSSGSSVPSSWSTSRESMTSTNKYLWHYQNIAYNDGTSIDTTKTVVGVYGDTGQQTYVWIRYSAVQPTQDSDIGTSPDNYIGIYIGLSDTAPTSYTSYTWYQYKGEKGDTGDPASVVLATIGYQQSDSGSVVPEGSWVSTVPSPVQGKYLWTRISITFNSGSPIVAYSVSRYGIDGNGSVVSVNGVSPDSNGNVLLSASDIQTNDSRSIQAHLSEIEDEIYTINRGIKGRRFLYIGDSYNSVTNTKWTDIVDGILGVSDSVVVAAGGYGFATTNTWLTLLQNATVTDESTITDILIAGGANDAWGTISNIPSAIATFDAYIKQRFTGLKDVWLGFAGNTYVSGTQRTNMRSAMRNYITGAKEIGWHYMHGLESTLFYAGNMQKIGADDYIHPNVNGVEALGNNIAQCVISGSCENYHAAEDITFTRNSSVGTGTFVITEAVNNNNLYISMGDISFTNTSALSSVVTLATCDELKNMLTPYTFINAYVTAGTDGYTAVLTFTNYNTLVMILPKTIGANVNFTVHGFSMVFDMTV